ncbi:MAG: hypothetical protein AAGE01_15475 [Pseudomonadota bacterium]
MLVDVENTLTGRHVTREARVAEGARAVHALVANRRAEEARRLVKIMQETIPDDPRVEALAQLVDEAASN